MEARPDDAPRICAVNASPRKKWNTATLLQCALDGAAAAVPGVQAEMLHLYDYTYTGCKSCFHCKRLGGRFYGRCALRDDLAPVLEKLSQADAIVFGSPIYFGDVTGMLRSLEERLLFPYRVYAEDFPSIAPKKIRTGFIYTMNVTAETMNAWGYPERLKSMEFYVSRIFGGDPMVLYANNTIQFSDYGKYKCEIFSGEEKVRYREEHFPEDRRKAGEMGAALISR